MRKLITWIIKPKMYRCCCSCDAPQYFTRLIVEVDQRTEMINCLLCAGPKAVKYKTTP